MNTMQAIATIGAGVVNWAGRGVLLHPADPNHQPEGTGPMAADDRTKKCTACGGMKPLADYGTRFDKRTGKRYPNGRCKPCDKLARLAAYAADPQRYRDYSNKFAAENRDKCAAWARRHYWGNRGEIVARRKVARPVLSPAEIARTMAEREQHERDYMRRYLHDYRHANRPYFRLSSAKYLAGNRAECNARVEAWRRANPEKHVAKENRRRALKAKAGGTVTGEQIIAMVKAQKGKCWYCTEPFGKKYHVDHRIPLSRGGSGGPENLVISCPTCNLRKGAKTPQEFAGMLF